jgi:hypothetical protein
MHAWSIKWSGLRTRTHNPTSKPARHTHRHTHTYIRTYITTTECNKMKVKERKQKGFCVGLVDGDGTAEPNTYTTTRMGMGTTQWTQICSQILPSRYGKEVNYSANLIKDLEPTCQFQFLAQNFLLLFLLLVNRYKNYFFLVQRK